MDLCALVALYLGTCIRLCCCASWMVPQPCLDRYDITHMLLLHKQYQ